MSGSTFDLDYNNPNVVNELAANEARQPAQNPMTLGNNRIRFRAGMANSAMRQPLQAQGMYRSRPGLMGNVSQRLTPGMAPPTMSPNVSNHLNARYGPNQFGGTGVVSSPGQAPPMNAIQQARSNGPDLAAIQAEMERRRVGAALGPRNAALAGSVMG